jgi:uncharacterized protein YjbI with pentapeptide repeats
MARKKVPSVPASAVQGKTFWLDSALRPREREDLEAKIQQRGGHVQADLDPGLDYLVLTEDRRATPGKSQAEKAVARLSGATVTTLYLNDLHALLCPSREEALALLRGGQACLSAWESILPVGGSTARIDLKGADLRGLDLTGFRFYACDLDGVRLEGTVLDWAWLSGVKSVDFTRAKSAQGLFVRECADCVFDGLHPLCHYVNLREVTRGSFRRTCLVKFDLAHGQWVDCRAPEADFTNARLANWKASNLDAAGALFPGARLEGAVLKRTVLDGADFSGAILEATDLEGACLRKANFRGAHLRGASLREADLRQADLRNACLAYADLAGCNVTGADFSGANLRGATLDKVTGTAKAKGLVQARAAIPTAGPLLREFLQALRKGGSEFHFVLELADGPRHYTMDFGGRYLALKYDSPAGQVRLEGRTDADALLDLATVHPDAVLALDGVQVQPKTLGKTLEPLACQALHEVFGRPIPEAKTLDKVKKSAREKSFSARDALIAELRRGGDAITAWNERPEGQRVGLGDFQDADFSGSDLRGVNFEKANLCRANFSNTNLRGARFFLAKLRKASLREADLRKADVDFVGAQDVDAEGADFREANLAYGRWRRANLKYANLRGANLCQAGFEGTDLTGADLADVTVHRTTYDRTTKFPAGFKPGPGWKDTSSRAKR